MTYDYRIYAETKSFIEIWCQYINNLETAGYCPLTPSAPNLPNADTPTAVRTVNDVTSFTCNFGFESSGGATSPFYTCQTNTVSAGSWSGVTLTCNSRTSY